LGRRGGTNQKHNKVGEKIFGRNLGGGSISLYKEEKAAVEGRGQETKEWPKGRGTARRKEM